MKTIKLSNTFKPVLFAVLALCTILGTNAGATTVTDTFTRTNGSDIGVTEDSNHYAWVLDENRWTNPTIFRETIDNDALLLDTSDGSVSGASGGAGIAGFTPSDFDMTVDMSLNGNPYIDAMHYAGITYRYDSLATIYETGNHGYSLVHNYWNNNSWNELQYNGVKIAESAWSVGANVDPAMHTYRIKAEGNHHQAWEDGTLLWDITNDGKLTGGYINLWREYSPYWISGARWDNLTVTENAVPEPSSILALISGLTLVAGITTKRRHS